MQKAFVPLSGQATAVYTSSGLDHYRHSDWLGSARLTASPTRTVLSTAAYAPFGETYAQSGSADLSFTGQNSDTASSDYDFLYREYSNQGRWASPDPAGLAVVDPAHPQSWNRYVYVLNNPLAAIDPTGLYCVYLSDDGRRVESIDDTSSSSECNGSGGYWIAGEFGGASQVSINSDFGLVSGYGYLDGSWQYSVAGATDSNAWGAWTQTVGGPPSDPFGGNTSGGDPRLNQLLNNLSACSEARAMVSDLRQLQTRGKLVLANLGAADGSTSFTGTIYIDSATGITAHNLGHEWWHTVQRDVILLSGQAAGGVNGGEIAGALAGQAGWAGARLYNSLSALVKGTPGFGPLDVEAEAIGQKISSRCGID